MPRGRKRKVPNESESADETMEESMGSVGVEESEPLSEKEVGEEGQVEGEADTAEAEDSASAGELEPGEVVVPSVDELKKFKAAAQEDITRMDVLVCGLCHFASHMMKEFVQHKKTCEGNSNIISATTKSDNKPQVWAFVLYKAYMMRQLEDESSDLNERSWMLYQKWSALDDHLKGTWVQAGRELMGIQHYGTFFNKRGAGRNLAITASEQHKQTLIQLQKELEDDPDPVTPTARGRPANSAKRIRKDEDEDYHGNERGEVRKRAGLNQVWRKSQRKGADETETELFTVEKIVAKRANPKLKSAEYLVKWVGLSSDQNSWEHASNLLTCKPVVDEFERNLARQKARKAAAAAEAQRLADRNAAIQNTGGRPVRTSALRALDQVKEWVGTKDAEGDDEEYTLVTSSAGVSQLVKKRIVPNANSNSPNKNTILMANSKGVLKLDHNQMANLSSGVYILSDQAGFVKVEDRAASKLSSVLSDSEGQAANNRTTMMINETEVRKVSANNKFTTFRKETPGAVKKENAPFSNLLQKKTVTNARTPRQIQQQQQQVFKARNTASPMAANRQTPTRVQKTVLGRGQQKVMRIIDEDNSILTNEDGTLCSIDGSMLGEEVGDPLLEDGGDGDVGVAEVDEDGLMRVAISPGGSLHQIVQHRPKHHVVHAEQEIPQEQQILQIEGEDGVIYNLTPEEHQMLLNNGSIVNTKQEPLEENTEMVIENGQIVRRLIGSDVDGTEGGTFVLAASDTMEGIKVEQGEGEEMDEESMLALQNEAGEQMQLPSLQVTTEEGTVEATLVQVEPLEPGATTRKVVLQTGETFVQTELDEEYYQSLGLTVK